MRLGHEVQIPLERRVALAPRRAVPPVGDAVTVGVPRRRARLGRERLEAAGVGGAVDEALLAAPGAGVGRVAGEGLADDALVVVVKDGLAGARVGEDALVRLGRRLGVDVRLEESGPCVSLADG